MDLNKTSTLPPKNTKKEKIIEETQKMVLEIGEYQYKLMAEKKHSLLVILQGMDGSGKDGAARRVFEYTYPAGMVVTSYKKPTEEELGHDFLWRIHKAAPEKGKIGIFNRSQYEDVIIHRVHNWIDDKKAKFRMDAINNLESLLVNEGNTTILKFMLHLSPERQLEKLEERKTDPTKQWKHNDGDWEERKHWADYMKYYNAAITYCNKIPWIVVPSDKRWYRNYVVANNVLAALKQIDPKFPTILPHA